MAIFTRFECPRCQHMFVSEGDADAFADCPKCQSMALAVGEATTGTVKGVPSEEAPPFPERAGDDGEKGVFSELLDATEGFPAPGMSDEGPHPFDESTVASPLPESLLGSQMMSAEDPYEDEDALHRAATQVLSSPHDATAHAPATEDLGAPFSEMELDSAFDLPADDEDAWENGPPPSVPTKQSAPVLDEDAWEDGPPQGVPTRDTAASLPRPPSTGELPRRANMALDITRQDAEAGAPSDELALDADATAASGELRAGAVLLSDLEAQFGGGVRLDEAADQGALSGQDLNALEQALSQMAGGTPRAEDALRQASQQVATSAFAIPTHSQLQRAVPAPPAEGEPPPLMRRQRPAHLTLSEEAKALAGIPIQATLGAGNIALDITRGSGQAPAATAPPRPTRPEESRPTGPVPAPPASEASEVTEAIRPARARTVPAPEEPKLFSGFTFARVAAVVLVAVLLGLGTGVLIAPKPEPKPVTPRSRAEQQFSDGNRYYAEGRFDDAFGSYRGAISVDRTFAPAHRAKAAALAKLQRGEEAAGAYRTYLDISPSAVDAEQVREVLRRYEGEASP